MTTAIAPVRVDFDAGHLGGHAGDLAAAATDEEQRWGTFGEVVATHVVGDHVYTDVQPRTRGGRAALVHAIALSHRHSVWEA